MTNHDCTECPLCMETLEIDDLSFYPCTCGYQICRFCWHRIRTDENGLCPACRKAYSEDPALFKPLSEDELQSMKKERRQKGTDKKQKLVDSRKHFAGLRVVQKNLVFVVGLSPRLSDGDVLKRHEYFGKFGKIVKVAVNPNTSYAGGQGHSASAYVTFQRPEDAMRAIKAVTSMHVDGKTLKACLGTTKYCSQFLKGAQCNKADCMYLHEPGDEAASFSKEEMQQGRHTEYEQELYEQFMNAANTVPPPVTQSQPVSTKSTSAAVSKKTSSPTPQPETALLSSSCPSSESGAASSSSSSSSQKASPTTIQSADSSTAKHPASTSSDQLSARSSRVGTPDQEAVSPDQQQTQSSKSSQSKTDSVLGSGDNAQAQGQAVAPVSRLVPDGDGQVKPPSSSSVSSWWPPRDSSALFHSHPPATSLAHNFSQQQQQQPSVSDTSSKVAVDVDYDAVDDDLGFDPWAVSNRGLADLLEKETAVQHQQSHHHHHHPLAASAGVNGFHSMMAGGLPYASGSRSMHGYSGMNGLNSISGGLKPSMVAPPGFMMNQAPSPHMTQGQGQQVNSDVRRNLAGGVPTVSSYPALAHNGDANAQHPFMRTYSSNGFQRPQSQVIGEPAKDWQEGLRALLPNISISFGGANSASQPQAQLQQHRGWSQSASDLSWEFSRSAVPYGSQLEDDTPHWMASIHSLTDDSSASASCHWGMPAPQAASARSPPPGFYQPSSSHSHTGATFATNTRQLTEGLQ